MEAGAHSKATRHTCPGICRFCILAWLPVPADAGGQWCAHSYLIISRLKASEKLVARISGSGFRFCGVLQKELRGICYDARVARLVHEAFGRLLMDSGCHDQALQGSPIPNSDEDPRSQQKHIKKDRHANETLDRSTFAIGLTLSWTTVSVTVLSKQWVAATMMCNSA